MSYKRKQEDKKRLKKLVISNWWPCGAYQKETSNHKVYLKRYWKSDGRRNSWSWYKKQARKTCRRYLKKNDLYTKKAYDLWWNAW